MKVEAPIKGKAADAAAMMMMTQLFHYTCQSYKYERNTAGKSASDIYGHYGLYLFIDTDIAACWWQKNHCC